jgi:hypothetical protein
VRAVAVALGPGEEVHEYARRAGDRATLDG